MDKLLSFIAIGIVGVVIGATGIIASRPDAEPSLGAVSGPDVYTYWNVHGVLTQGGGVFATTSAGASTLSAADIASKNVVERSGTGALTLTLPASTTITGINDAGQVRTIYVFNAGSGSITVAGGSGTLLESASTTAIIANGFGRIDLVRKANTDIEALFVPGV
jgi:hypothetical protein